VGTDASGGGGWFDRHVSTPPLDVRAAVRAMPRVHAQALRGALAGFDDDELATLVDLPPESIRPLVRLATAKLGALLAEPGARPPS
jgi:DNA-directed RNA polymerase specialized sigma24 family protein